jgi:D-3-phosphoglycerate dehydrogenase
MSKTTSLDKSKIKFLLLEGVHQNAVDTLKAAGYTNIEYLKGALSEEELKEKIADVHFIGIRSRTQLTEEVFDCAKKLVAVGCFCIGTNQVNLDAARERGMAAFIGRLRPCPALDYKFVALGHNTVRGAAGAAVLNAELMLTEGMLGA